MPRYDYDCAACGERFEVMHGVHADPPTTCALCGRGPVRKAISAPSVHFKGSGWAKKERHASARSAASSKSGDDGASEPGSKDAGSKDAGSREPGVTVPEPKAPTPTTSSSDGASTAKATSKTPTATAD